MVGHMDDERNLEQERSQPRGEALQSLLSAELQRRRSQYRPLGRPRPKKYNGRVMVLLVLAASVAVFPGVFLLAGSGCWGSGSRQSNQSGRPSIALVDQLAIESPNPGFVQSVNSSASAAGYRFDYYPPKSATVDFFVQFPRLGYSIIILRTHGAGLVSTDPTVIAILRADTRFHKEFHVWTLSRHSRTDYVLRRGPASLAGQSLHRQRSGSIRRLEWPGYSLSHRSRVRDSCQSAVRWKHCGQFCSKCHSGARSRPHLWIPAKILSHSSRRMELIAD